MKIPAPTADTLPSLPFQAHARLPIPIWFSRVRSEEHTSELQSPDHLVCRLLLEKTKIGRRPERGEPVRRTAARFTRRPIRALLPLQAAFQRCWRYKCP